jgi:hypothetical protein
MEMNNRNKMMEKGRIRGRRRDWKRRNKEKSQKSNRIKEILSHSNLKVLLLSLLA